MKKVLVSCPYPFTGTKSALCERSMAAIDGYQASGLLFKRNEVRGSNVPRARNVACTTAIQEGYNWILHIDADVEFTPAQAVNLICNNEEDAVIGGAYTLRNTRQYYCAGNWSTMPGISPQENRVPVSVKEKVPVDWAGTGFLALNLDVLKKVLPSNAPWFRYELLQMPDGSEDFTGDDLGFAVYAGRYGVKIFLDCGIVVGHHPFILPSSAPSVDLRDWALTYNDMIDQLRDMGKNVAKQFQHYAKSMGG